MLGAWHCGGECFVVTIAVLHKVKREQNKTNDQNQEVSKKLY